MSASAILRLNGLVLLLFLLASLAVWSELPDRIPVHFNFRGEPDGWARTSVVSWLALPALATALVIFLWGIGRVAARRPELWNVPEKQLFLRMSPEARGPVVASLEAYVGWVALGITGVLMALQLGIYRVALGHAERLSWSLEIGLLGGVLGP